MAGSHVTWWVVRPRQRNEVDGSGFGEGGGSLGVSREGDMYVCLHVYVCIHVYVSVPAQ